MADVVVKIAPGFLFGTPTTYMLVIMRIVATWFRSAASCLFAIRVLLACCSGLASKSAEEGKKAIGKHARTIRLGRSLWQSPPLTEHVSASMQERFSDDGTFSPWKDVERALTNAKLA